METKEYYNSLIAVIEYIVNDGYKEISVMTGRRLAGNLWPRIFNLFVEKNIGIYSDEGTLLVRDAVGLAPIYEDCKHALDKIEKQEADRLLDNAAKEASIKYARRALIISILALAIATGSFIWQVFSSMP